VRANESERFRSSDPLKTHEIYDEQELKANRFKHIRASFLVCTLQWDAGWTFRGCWQAWGHKERAALKAFRGKLRSRVKNEPSADLR
jgi:hypothetical protein